MGKTIDSFFKKLPSTPLRKSPRKSVVSTPWNQYSLFAHALRSHTLACVRTFTTHTHATPNACTLVSHTMQRNVSRSHSLARVRALTTHTHATPDCMHNCTLAAHTTRHAPRIHTRTQHLTVHAPHTFLCRALNSLQHPSLLLPPGLRGSNRATERPPTSPSILTKLLGNATSPLHRIKD